jgi:hypothetical protein
MRGIGNAVLNVFDPLVGENEYHVSLSLVAFRRRCEVVR